MDHSVNPGDDFYRYVNGDWIAGHPVPPDKIAYDTFTELDDITEERLRALVEEPGEQTRSGPGSPARKIVDFYRAGMDTGSIEGLGLTPLQEELDRIGRIRRNSDVLSVIAHLQTLGIAPCFEVFAEIDARNSTRMIAGIAQGGLGLPTRDYYFRKDPEAENIRTHYHRHIARMYEFLEILSLPEDRPADLVMNMEIRLAGASFSPEENRDPEHTYHPMDIDAMEQAAPGIDWHSFFAAIGYPALQVVNVHQPQFFRELGSMVPDTGIEGWKAFLRWKLIASLAPFLDSRLEKENFDFYGRLLNGQQQMKPRWKRVLAALDFALGEVLGKLYVERYFPPEGKEKAIALVENLRAAFRTRIGEISWMGGNTREEALAKLSRMDLKIGYPDRWRDYDGLEVDVESYARNILRAMAYEFRKGPGGLDRAGEPVDRSVWYMYPQTINAYYDPGMNEIVIPAAILQPPFFGPDAGDDCNYGAIGAIIGHEMTHGFDDMGRKYDRDGNLRDWWTAEDEKEFARNAQVIADQYSSVEVLPGLRANGRLTLGENIADLGGLTIACHAFMQLAHPYEGTRDQGRVSDLQRFFKSYASIWRESIRPEALRNQVLTDVHAPNNLRVNCVVSNIPEFYSAFPGITPGNLLFHPSEMRPGIW